MGSGNLKIAETFLTGKLCTSMVGSEIKVNDKANKVLLSGFSKTEKLMRRISDA